jgi:cystathionine beta-lyase/cystathionine gamma-synthase
MKIDADDIRTCIEDHPAREPGIEPMATPIYQTSLFAFESLEAFNAAASRENKHTVYSRGQNPTVEVLEKKLAALERGEACKAFGSGMAAISSVMFGLLNQGDHILFVNHTYGPALQLAKQLERFGISHTLLLDIGNDDVRSALQPNTKMVWLENPGTMVFRTLDLAGIAEISRAHGAVTCIDNSWASPLFQKPILHGIDIVVHSATKYIGGHSDVVAGTVITTDERMQQIFYRAYMLLGGILHPFDAWLLLRGLRTMPVRMQQHHNDALQVAEFLRSRPEVAEVFHPAFADDCGTLTGYSGLFSFALKDAEFDQVKVFIDKLRRFRIGVSWGGVESLVLTPNRGYNERYMETNRLPHGLIRLSIGLEGAEALIDDLSSAFISA